MFKICNIGISIL